MFCSNSRVITGNDYYILLQTTRESALSQADATTLDGKSDEEKVHSMLNEEFWGVDVDEESGLVYGPFKHAFKCIAKYVAAAWKIRNAYGHPSDVA